MGREVGEDTKRGLNTFLHIKLRCSQESQEAWHIIPGFKELVKCLISISVIVASMPG